MKSTYISPEVTVILTTNVDVMNGSDTFIDVGSLWSATTDSETV